MGQEYLYQVDNKSTSTHNSKIVGVVPLKLAPNLHEGFTIMEKLLGSFPG